MINVSELEKQMYLSVGNNVNITLKDGTMYNGFCMGFTSSADNEPEPADIDLENEQVKNVVLCLMESEIKSITICKD